ncbi:hypothetical protein GCM10027597_18850 [Saccharopolyspora tripterygii]
MTTSATRRFGTSTESASTELDLAAEATFFSELLKWPVSIDVTHKRLVVRTGDVLDALVLPRTLAEPVALELSSSLMTGPVSRDESSGWWTFITEPCQRQSAELPHELRVKRVHAIPPRGQLVIPPVTESASWWQQPQPGRLLPPWSAVVAIARRVIDRGSNP